MRYRFSHCKRRTVLGKKCIADFVLKICNILTFVFSTIYNREEDSKRKKSYAANTLSNDKCNAFNKEDFYTGGGKRTTLDNVETRNFLADSFLGRNEVVHAPPQQHPPAAYSHYHAMHHPMNSYDRDRDYDGRSSRSRSHSRHRKKRYYSSSSDCSTPEPRRRKRKSRYSSPPPATDNNNNAIVKID